MAAKIAERHVRGVKIAANAKENPPERSKALGRAIWRRTEEAASARQ